MLKRPDSKEMVPGKWLGLGGKVEPGEDIVESAIREFQEETGLLILDPKLRGTFTWIDRSELAGTLYIFTSSEYEGDLIDECKEGVLSWMEIDKIDQLEMLATHQKLFLKKILEDDTYFYTGVAVYDGDDLTHYSDSNKYFEDRRGVN